MAVTNFASVTTLLAIQPMLTKKTTLWYTMEKFAGDLLFGLKLFKL